ncbi:upstream activation factor subunit UAF30-like [Wolffia australiana]
MAARSLLSSSSTFMAGQSAMNRPLRHLPTSAPFNVVFRGRRSFLTLCRASNPPSSAEKNESRGRGITRPRPISPELQELLGVPEIPRTQALKQIWAYIKEKNLQDPDNKKIIVCDERLKKVFGGKDRVGFLEISGLLNPHFVK